MARTTAHRPSQAGSKYVRNSRGDRVQNTAYRGPRERPAARADAQQVRQSITADTEAVALCKEFNDNMHGVVALPGRRSGTVDIVQGEYSGSVIPHGEEAIVTASKGGRVVGNESYPIEMAISAFASMTRNDQRNK